MNDTTQTQGLTRRQLRELAAQEQAQRLAATQTTTQYESVDTAIFAIDTSEYNEAQLEVIASLEAAVQVPKTDAAGNPLDRRGQRRAKREAFDKLLAEWEAQNGPLANLAVANPAPVAAPEQMFRAATMVTEAGSEIPTHLLPTEAIAVSEVTEQLAQSAQQTAPQVTAATDAAPAAAPVQESITESAQAPAEPVTAAPKSAFAPVSAGAKEYSFPDIVPLEESGSIFDADKQAANESASSGFDALLTSAVADESSASVSNGTAALILPAMPEDAALAAALDEESGVFISGSIQLPQSVGETGGHHSIHGVETGDQEVLDEIFETGSHTKPVAALRAVSSQHAQAAPMLGETKTDTSKAPMIFLIAGGVLVATAAGVLIAAFAGFFN